MCGFHLKLLCIIIIINTSAKDFYLFSAKNRCETIVATTGAICLLTINVYLVCSETFQSFFLIDIDDICMIFI